MQAHKIAEFRKQLEALPREELLDIIRHQNPELVMHVERIEWVFENKLGHLTWADGSPIEGRQVTNEELALLVDPPFEVDNELLEMGISAEQQYQLYIAADPVLWAREYLGAKPRAYQIFILRHPKLRKVLRAGRRLGKTWSLAILSLHYAYTHNNGRVLVIAPMKSHVELIFQEVMNQAKTNMTVYNSITRSPTSPQFLIEMSNGSTIRFFTSGMRSGGKTDVARGQEAHIIILDELDYMAPEDLDAVYVMLQQTAEGQEKKRLIGASTPTGLRERFWKWCNDTRRFKEFWLPSYVNPYWTKAMEEEFREEHGEMVYRHEVEADWGENAEGVYPRRYVDRAFSTGRLLEEGKRADVDKVKELSDWEYGYTAVSGKSFFVMGVDWDKYGAGTSIVVLEVCGMCEDSRFENRVRLAYREETSKGEYSLLGAVERIKELNNIFHPRHIYIDKGFGEVQAEMLHAWGVEHPETGLRKSVKPIAFKSNIEVRDPATKLFTKKEMKPFMVENLRFMMEKDELAIPSHDEELYLQLISYIVLGVTQSGAPKFDTAGNVPDHAHDALILACLAITENYDDLFMSRVSRLGQTVVDGTILSPLGEEAPVTGKPNKNSRRTTRSMTVGMGNRGRSPIKRKTF